MKQLLLTLGTVVLAGCGAGISGEYGGEKCLYEKIAFRGDGNVYLTVMGMEQAGQYKVDGDKIAISVPSTPGIVFTKNGDVLEAGMLGDKMECKKL